MSDNGSRGKRWSPVEIRSAGAAVDLGTTEIRSALWDLGRRRCVGRRYTPNPQARFGADVLSRLSHASASATASAELREITESAIGEALQALCAGLSVSPSALRSVVIVGNTAMLALLTGTHSQELLRPGSWRRKLDCRFEAPAAALRGWGLSPDCRLTIVQPLAGFVGSDLLAGVLALGLDQGPAGSLLIDFGANTEIALWDGARLWATSAAGGPAFEGGGIRCGMPARPGAVQSVACSDTSPPFSLDVIGGERPRGICGSGLVDAAACMLRMNMITAFGRFTGNAAGAESIRLDGDGNVVVTPQDIDALQRAKAGVAASVRCLMKKAQLESSALLRVCVSGAFGTYMNVANGRLIGLLPPIGEDMVELCGNTALAGCEQLLVGEQGFGTAEGPDVTVECMSFLPGYEEAFVENLFLRPWDDSHGLVSGKGAANARSGNQSV
jgi:uncharacterized 2Fe-2S/4Fe-4S cluster protein (DUF4445 family)